MSKNVILFLANPDSITRSKMVLKNFKQLLKIGYDIVTLSVTDLLPQYIIENSKSIIYDYTSHKCDKKFYYDYYKNSGGCGDYLSDDNEQHRVVFYHTTHFPSILRNYRSLITYAKNAGYEKYFYIEDDHYIDDLDLILIKEYFEKLNEYDLITFNFTDVQPVYCTYFNFGKVDLMFDISKNFAYTEYEYKNTDSKLYGHFFENVFTDLISKYKPGNYRVLKEKQCWGVFSNSSVNQVYSYRNLIYDGRCNFLHDVVNNKPVFYYSGISLTSPVDLKIYVDNKLRAHTTVYPACWYFLHIEEDLIGKTKVVINDNFVKTFDASQNIMYNGELVFHT
jgi:hypothetical protein